MTRRVVEKISPADPDHPEMATSLNSLAYLRATEGKVAEAEGKVAEAEGKLAEAKALHERALAIREKRLGPEHPDTAWSLNEIASLLQAQRDLVGARSLYERALAINEKALGPGGAPPQYGKARPGRQGPIFCNGTVALGDTGPRSSRFVASSQRPLQRTYSDLQHGAPGTIPTVT